jgi:hypothetical protein
MNDVIIQEALLSKGKVKVAVLIYTGSDDPVIHLDEAVSHYTKGQLYNEFIDANMDNPWTRVIIRGINDMDQRYFDPKVDKL